MRVVVVGTSGAGKTTLASRISLKFGLPHIELDAINWQPGWRDLNSDDQPEFVRRASVAVSAPSWVVDGNYSILREVIWPRATDLIWLDYSLKRIMAQVIKRSLSRAWNRTDLWDTGNREDWARLFRPSHPIRWAWGTWEKNRQNFSNLLTKEMYGHLRVFRLHHPHEVERVLAKL